MRINLFGGPGCGKSVASARIYAEMSLRGQMIDLIFESVKGRAWLNIPLSFEEQEDVFFKQLEEEEARLSNNVNIVTDSPLAQILIYAETYPNCDTTAMVECLAEHNKKYRALNIFLRRDGVYNQAGRFHTLEESRKIDRAVTDYLDTVGNYVAIKPAIVDTYFDWIEELLVAKQ